MSPTSRVFRYATFDLRALLSLAEQFRDVSCSCDESVEPNGGSQHWAIVLSFDDGVEWIFRSPRQDNGFSEKTIAELIESEVATMKFLKQNSSIPLPDVKSHW